MHEETTSTTSFRRKTHRSTILALSIAISLVINLPQNSPVLAEPLYSSTSSSVTIDNQQAGTTNNQQHEASRSLPTQIVSNKSPLHGRQFGDTINDIQIECNSDNIVVTLTTNQGFNGMIYPKGLSKNSTCMMEYHQMSSNITYYLPLKSCNTMSSDVEDGVEYFNTVMVQPHRRLVTNQGRGYHIRCRYQTKERTITNQDQQLSVNLTHVTPSVMGSAAMPSCTMRIYGANDLTREVAAENVRIGDELHLVISLDDQDVYGMLVTNCLVRDGMNWGEQPLLDDHGCPVDEDIMPQFVYAQNLTRASVTFQAHKFPYTSSVYYQCNVRLCFREGGCNHVPPNCSDRQRFGGQNFKSINGNEVTRHKRWVDGGELDGVASEEILKSANVANPRDLSIEVTSGLHVDETETEAGSNSAAVGGADQDPMMAASTNDDPEETGKQTADSKQSERDFCMSLRRFAIAISLASLLLMTAIIIMIACLIQRRKREKLEAQMHSPYDQGGPYSNRAYCRD